MHLYLARYRDTLRHLLAGGMKRLLDKHLYYTWLTVYIYAKQGIAKIPLICDVKRYPRDGTMPPPISFGDL